MTKAFSHHLSFWTFRSSPQQRARKAAKRCNRTRVILSTVLEEYGVKGEIVKVRPGPVVTLYELEPAPGTKTSRVIGLVR